MALLVSCFFLRLMENTARPMLTALLREQAPVWSFSRPEYGSLKFDFPIV